MLFRWCFQVYVLQDDDLGDIVNRYLPRYFKNSMEAFLLVVDLDSNFQ